MGIFYVFCNSALEADLEIVRADKDKLEKMLRYSFFMRQLLSFSNFLILVKLRLKMSQFKRSTKG